MSSLNEGGKGSDIFLLAKDNQVDQMTSEDKTSVNDRSTQFMANERTFLAWLRTSIGIIGLGFIVARFSLFLREFGLIMTKEGGGQILQDASIHSPSSLLGLSMVGLGVLLIVYALYNYRKAHGVIAGGGAYVSRHSIMYVASVGLAAFGVIVIAYLLLISI